MIDARVIRNSRSSQRWKMPSRDLHKEAEINGAVICEYTMKFSGVAANNTCPRPEVERSVAVSFPYAFVITTMVDPELHLTKASAMYYNHYVEEISAAHSKFLFLFLAYIQQQQFTLQPWRRRIA